jgi:hypothetical protein
MRDEIKKMNTTIRGARKYPRLSQISEISKDENSFVPTSEFYLRSRKKAFNNSLDSSASNPESSCI